MSTLDFLGSKTVLEGQVNKLVHTCKKCTYSTKSFFYIQNHVKCHKPPKLGTLFNCSDSTPEQFCCKDCDFTTFYTIEFKTHLKNHKPQEKTEQFYCQVEQGSFEANSLTNSTKETDNLKDKCKRKELFQCNLCSYSTFMKSNLSCHKLGKHTPNPIKWFNCSHCKYRTQFEAYLKDHVQRSHIISKHQNEPGWLECEHCHYKTKCIGALATHNVRLHEKAFRLFKCDLCSYKAKRKCNLKQHIFFKHTTEKMEWCHCDKCPAKFKTKYHLQRHVGTVHVADEDKVKCSACGSKLKCMEYLRNHMERKHGILIPQ